MAASSKHTTLETILTLLEVLLAIIQMRSTTLEAIFLDTIGDRKKMKKSMTKSTVTKKSFTKSYWTNPLRSRTSILKVILLLCPAIFTVLPKYAWVKSM